MYTLAPTTVQQAVQDGDMWARDTDPEHTTWINDLVTQDPDPWARNGDPPEYMLAVFGEGGKAELPYSAYSEITQPPGNQPYEGGRAHPPRASLEEGGRGQPSRMSVDEGGRAHMNWIPKEPNYSPPQLIRSAPCSPRSNLR